jgi:hypothetical protein
VTTQQYDFLVLCGVNMVFTEGPEPIHAELRVDVLRAGKWIAGDARALSAGDPLVTDALIRKSRAPDSAEDVPVSWLFVPCRRERVESSGHGAFVQENLETARRMLPDQSPD